MIKLLPLQVNREVFDAGQAYCQAGLRPVPRDADTGTQLGYPTTCLDRRQSGLRSGVGKLEQFGVEPEMAV
jgi:hypothetical protein